MRRFGILAPILPTDLRDRSGDGRTRNAAFLIAPVAVILAMAVSGNTPEVMGIDHASNSLGRVSVDLLLIVACMAAMTGFPRRAAALWRRQSQLHLCRRAIRLSTQPVFGKFAGLKP